MSTLHIIYRPKGTKPYKLSAAELQEAQITFNYDYTEHKPIYEDYVDDFPVIIGYEELEVTRDYALQNAHKVAIDPYYVNFDNGYWSDTWIVDSDGSVVAVISFSINIEYL